MTVGGWKSRAGDTGYSPVRKSSHEVADYRQGTTERHCSVCSMFVYAQGVPHCRSVADPIRVMGLCDYYRRKK